MIWDGDIPGLLNTILFRSIQKVSAGAWADDLNFTL